MKNSLLAFGAITASLASLSSGAPASDFAGSNALPDQITFEVPSSEEIANALPSENETVELIKDLKLNFEDLIGHASVLAGGALEAVEKVLEGLADEVKAGWRGLTAKDYEGFEVVTHEDFPEYQIRVKSPNLCDTNVKQYSGYMDISDTKHLFFWFFESRDVPLKDPLVMWLNGGPGCSSSTGLLFELGPCTIADNGEGTKLNPNSWNSHANMIFLDQPINVGYSYSSGGESINNTPAAAVDVYAFLQLWYRKFPEYSKLPFHLAAESYGGTYVPNFGSYIHKGNKDLAAIKAAKASIAAPVPAQVHIPLTTLLIGNGLTEAYTQFATVPDYACAPSKFAIFDEQTCEGIRSKIPTCQRLQKLCYDNPSRFTCVPAGLYCWGNVVGPIQRVNVNPYDVRKPCNRDEDGSLCYKELNWIETYLNKPEIKAELGAPLSLNFESCNMRVNQAFQLTGDSQHNSALLLPPMLDDGIRLLIYAGEADFMCNYLGNKAWMGNLESKFQDGFNKGKDHVWTTLEDGKKAGLVRAVGGGAGNYTYVQVFDSGHMVPADQPEAALDLFERWLSNIPLYKNDD